jgi:DNA-binding LytR/AlgR family response regulator
MIREPYLVHVLIVEADSSLVPGLLAGLRQAGYAITGVARNAEEAGRLFANGQVDVIVADIHLPGDKDGIETMLELMKIKRIPIIYLTMSADAAIIEKAKQSFPAAIIIKPYDITNISVAIALAVHNYTGDDSQEPASQANVPASDAAREKRDDIVDKETILRQGNSIFIKRNFQFIKIGLSEILYIEADGNYVHIVIRDKKFTVRLSLIQVIRKINYSKLVRVNRSAVINVNAIQSFNKEQVVIAQYEISIGKNYKDGFFNLLGFR